MKNNKSLWLIGLLTGVLAIAGCKFHLDNNDLNAGPAPVKLFTAGNYVILSESGVTTVPMSTVTGNIGVSPIASTGITGFSLILNNSGTFSISSQVVGKVYAADYAAPTPAILTDAINDMKTAYLDAAGRTTPNFTNLGSGDISGLILVPGLYRWDTGVTMTSDVTLNGGPNSVWIFQVSGVLSMASGVKIKLTGGARAKNIFWQTVSCTLNTTAHLEGIVLSSTAITLATGATVNGRLLAQTAVTLDKSTVKKPAQ